MSSSKYKVIKTDNGYMQEHRYIIEQYLGRKLTDDEVVHHINKDKSDNKVENLQVMTRKEHTALHGKERIGKKYNKQASKRVPLRLPAELNKKVEDEAKQLGISKNSYITMKLQDKLKK